MRSRERRIDEEAAALWREVFREPPPVRADGRTMLDVITQSLPEATYERFVSPHLRPSQVVFPRRSRTGALKATRSAAGGGSRS